MFLKRAKSGSQQIPNGNTSCIYSSDDTLRRNRVQSPCGSIIVFCTLEIRITPIPFIASYFALNHKERVDSLIKIQDRNDRVICWAVNRQIVHCESRWKRLCSNRCTPWGETLHRLHGLLDLRISSDYLSSDRDECKINDYNHYSYFCIKVIILCLFNSTNSFSQFLMDDSHSGSHVLNGEHIQRPQDTMFTSIYRSASFTDISRQTNEQDLSIVVGGNDTLMNKMSPSISKKMITV